MKICFTTAYIFLILNYLYSKPIYLYVRIYSTVTITEAKVAVFSGKYELFNSNNERVTMLYKNSDINLKSSGSEIEVFQNNSLILKSKEITLKSSGFINTFEIEPTKPSYAKRIYDDDLTVRVSGKNLILINRVELERYVAGVVESEGTGTTTDSDFFVLQAIACRTYALANVRKHIHEGFHLCDDVHCQLYRGRCRNSLILMSASKTTGKVIIDETGKMITAAFCSNSGGQTMNSEDVWTLPTPYLRSIIDTFSLKGRNYKWEVRMPTSEWLDFLKTKYNYPIEDSLKRQKALNFKQENRLVYFPDSIHLKDIRLDLGLRSTFFSVIHLGDEILLDGRGYGHGVGLSQEGAIEMIKQGYSYEDVIYFYYQNVKIEHIDNLNYFFINYLY